MGNDPFVAGNPSAQSNMIAMQDLAFEVRILQQRIDFQRYTIDEHEKKIRRLRAKLGEAQSHAFNLTPDRTVDDWSADAVSQIQLLVDRLRLQAEKAGGGDE